ncbi:hypothetical protein SADUNF_Sadunf08G0054400 [Salix dunnii]|uniref:Uncharacterized protein n=1 Tax=Salix dunnii TaxID=1413687 RepID=A0A835JX37_9ROSI|nr:hypothetical protein SADUNF_Sadunf08G0054400 [Salix dunnii]
MVGKKRVIYEERQLSIEVVILLPCRPRGQGMDDLAGLEYKASGIYSSGYKVEAYFSTGILEMLDKWPCPQFPSFLVLVRDLFVNASGLMILVPRQDYKRFQGSLNVSLKAVRFLPGKEAMNVIAIDEAVESEDQRLVDEKYLSERVTINDKVQFIHTLWKMGRGQGMIKPFALELSEWSSFDELEPLGDALPPSDFAQHASILVVQQYRVSATKNNYGHAAV